ncbi:carboxypeptidase regulatory-like domain-containing protein [Candidatus Falkowbacteria bacterium]|nr:carboxypeptidase regulatory-like domain-containing protein [Candidatus Falkowbacteria bacterium]
MLKKIKTNNSGFSLISILVGVFIIILAGLGIWNVFNFSLKIIRENKNRTLATAIANEKAEIIRNLPYDDIGTQSGIPAGAIPQVETITRNNSEFTITTSIFYVDDSYDNLVPFDLLGADYKKIKLSVEWPGRTYGDPVNSYTTVVPKGVETDVEGGTIRVIVFNGSGEPIPEANVQIINNDLDPVINISSITDQSGILLVPGAPPTVDKTYEIIVSKAGYTTEKTYPEIDEMIPITSNAQVLDDQITEKSFTIDIVSTFVITTIGKDYPSNWKINTALTSAGQLAPDVSIDSNNYYYFVWHDDKDTGSFRIYAQKYSSGKIAQWAEDKRISNANNQSSARIATDGTAVYIAWNDDRDDVGNQDSYLIKLDSNGNEVWVGDKKIASPNSNMDQSKPSVDVQSSTGDSYIAFQENSGASDTWDIYVHKYDSSGNPGWANPIKANEDATSKNQNYPEIIFFNDTLNDDKGIYVVWQDFRNDNWDIYAHRYNATGTALWTNNIKINTDLVAANQTLPKIAIDSLTNLYIVWQDDRNTNFDIYAHKYSPGGNEVWTEEIKVNQNIDTANQTEPAIAIDSNNELFISWTDERNIDTQGKDIYAQKIDNDTTILWSNDERIIFNDDADNHQEKSNLTVDTAGYAVYTWQDERDEDTDVDIFAARYKTPGSIVPISNVPITIKGTKLIYQNPDILKHDNNYTTDGSGNLTLTDVEWDSYTIEPQSTSSYSLMSSDPPQPIIINPGESIDIELNIE